MYKHIIKRFVIDRDFDFYPATDEGHRDFYKYVDTKAEEENDKLQKEMYINCEWRDLPIFNDTTHVTHVVVEIEELPKIRELSVGTLKIYHNSVIVGDNYENCELAIQFLEDKIVDIKADIEHCKRLQKIKEKNDEI